MMRAWLLPVLLVSSCQLCPACAGCNPDPVNPGTGGAGGYWPTPPVTGGSTSTGGTGTGGWEPLPTGGTGGAASEAELVCQHLVDIGCPEGSRVSCVEQVEFYLADDRFDLDTDCLLLAGTKDAVRRCGGIVCEDSL